ncbi:hypothetical protein [Amycolatopsis palatopharyngis]|uniref:hypothetical protein n=1 Tax=Amycolatopsis palatopharyngis TaxID=187982 RepID=UPI000E26C65C|nr:hypothetical protein [Amycolatopsis palatopharyngis]
MEPESARPDSGTEDGPAVTTDALSADPVPPVRDEEPRAHRDPVADPSGAARELPEASGGQTGEPDLAEVPGRGSPGITAARFEVDIPGDVPDEDRAAPEGGSS